MRVVSPGLDFDGLVAQTAQNALICYIFFEYTTTESAVTPKGLSLATAQALIAARSVSRQRSAAF